jgi:hypothetical protein
LRSLLKLPDEDLFLFDLVFVEPIFSCGLEPDFCSGLGDGAGAGGGAIGLGGSGILGGGVGAGVDGRCEGIHIVIPLRIFLLKMQRHWLGQTDT